MCSQNAGNAISETQILKISSYLRYLPHTFGDRILSWGEGKENGPFGSFVRRSHTMLGGEGKENGAFGSFVRRSHTMLGGGGQGKWGLWQFCSAIAYNAGGGEGKENGAFGSFVRRSHTMLGGGGQGKWGLWQFCPTTEESLKNALVKGWVNEKQNNSRVAW